MRFADLMKRLTDYVNLGKLIVDTVPGVLLALGIVLVLGDLGKIPLPLYFHTSDIGPQKHRPGADINDYCATQVGRDGLRVCRNHLEKTLSVAQGRVDTTQNRIAADSLEVERISKRLEAAYQRYEDQKKQDVSLANSTAREIDTLEYKIDSLTTVIAHRKLQKYDMGYRIPLLTEELELVKRRIELSRNFGVLIEEIINSILAVGLFGFLLGTVLNPINKLVWINPKLEIVQNWSFLANIVRQDAQIAERVRPRKRSSAQGTMNADIQLEAVYEGDADFNSTNPRLFPPTYYVGKGVISQEEYDSYITNYYRYSEVSANLILPAGVFIFGLLAVLYQVSSGWWHLLRAILAIMSGGLFFYLARKRYIDFVKRINDLIVGRLQKLLKDKKEREQVELEDLKKIVKQANESSQILETQTKNLESAVAKIELVLLRGGNGPRTRYGPLGS